MRPEHQEGRTEHQEGFNPRAVATALLLLPAEQPASEQDVPVLVYGVQAGAARAGVGPVAHPGRAGRENRVSDAVCGRARSRALADHQSPRMRRCAPQIEHPNVKIWS